MQPAFFEAFGLTVVEAMASGVPTFATRYGGRWKSLKTRFRGFISTPTVVMKRRHAWPTFLNGAKPIKNTGNTFPPTHQTYRGTLHLAPLRPKIAYPDLYLRILAFFKRS
ncbi:MAG: glycosyltransferase [Desulfofustis sp. PB-SRB1]|nr:glycosyltransferase [Desulfofustis sp. PB-SRB1]